MNEIEGRYNYGKPVRIPRDEVENRVKAKHLENHLDSALHLLIEMNFERAKMIIEKLAAERKAA